MSAAFSRRKRLTDLEKQALRLVMDGKSNKEIADELSETEECVKARVRSAMIKVGVRHSRQLIPRASEIAALVSST